MRLALCVARQERTDGLWNGEPAPYGDRSNLATDLAASVRRVGVLVKASPNTRLRRSDPRGGRSHADGVALYFEFQERESRRR